VTNIKIGEVEIEVEDGLDVQVTDKKISVKARAAIIQWHNPSYYVWGQTFSVTNSGTTN
jgi:hypothetical protein